MRRAESERLVKSSYVPTVNKTLKLREEIAGCIGCGGTGCDTSDPYMLWTGRNELDPYGEIRTRSEDLRYQVPV